MIRIIYEVKGKRNGIMLDLIQQVLSDMALKYTLLLKVQHLG